MRPTAHHRLADLRHKLGVTQKLMARLLGITERTVADLERGRELSDAIARRTTELERLQRALAKVVRPQAIGNWLTRPSDAFDGDAPADLVAAGKVDLLWQMVFNLRSGISS